MDESGNPLPERRKRGAPLGNKRALCNRGGGRKTVYSPRMAVIARKCCEGGMTDVEVAKMLGIGLATLYRWKVEHPAFSRVFKLGKAKADDRVERSLYSRAVGYDYIAEKPVMTRHGQKTMRYRQHIPPDTAAAVWYLKNRRPDRWRDAHRHEHVATPYDGIEDATELRTLLTKQAQALGLIAPPIIDVTPEASSPAQAENPSEAPQTPAIAAKHERRAQGRPTTLPDLGAAPIRDLKPNNDQ
jgi:transposase-like protein